MWDLTLRWLALHPEISLEVFLKYFNKETAMDSQPWTKDRLLPTLWGNLSVSATWVQSWCFLIRWVSVWLPILHLQVQFSTHGWQVCLEAQLGLQVCHRWETVTTSCRRCARVSETKALTGKRAHPGEEVASAVCPRAPPTTLWPSPLLLVLRVGPQHRNLKKASFLRVQTSTRSPFSVF